MSTTDLSTLAGCEAVIERGLGTFVEVGEALLTIREARLYRETHKTFEEYCRERWGFNRNRASQLIVAAEVAGTLPTTVGTAPPNEAVARELAPLRQEPEKLREKWSETVEKHGPAPTAQQVRATVRGESPGRDGHENEASEPAPETAARTRSAPRTPITDDVRSLVVDLARVERRVVKLGADDRLVANRKALRETYLNHLLRFRAALAEMINRIEEA